MLFHLIFPQSRELTVDTFIVVVVLPLPYSVPSILVLISRDNYKRLRHLWITNTIILDRINVVCRIKECLSCNTKTVTVTL